MNTAYRIVQRDLQKLLNELREESDKYSPTGDKTDRARRGAYVDSMCLLEETMENILGELSIVIMHSEEEFDSLSTSVSTLIDENERLKNELSKYQYDNI